MDVRTKQLSYGMATIKDRKVLPILETPFAFMISPDRLSNFGQNRSLSDHQVHAFGVWRHRRWQNLNSAPVATIPFSCFPDKPDTYKVRQTKDEESRVRIHTYWRLDLDFHQSRFYGSGKMPR